MKKTSTQLFFSVSIFLCASTVSFAQVNEQDSLALVDLYKNTDGPNWVSSDNWLTGPVTTWYGITVEADRVVAVNLDHNLLSGPVPSSLGNLTAVKNMYLEANDLSGNIPSSLGSLTAVQNLDVGSNQLSGEIPVTIGSLTNLKYFNANLNKLTGAIPEELGSLTNLTDLYLDANELSGAVPSSIGSLTKLRVLSVSLNKLTGIPVSLGSLQSLAILDLSSNLISGSIPTSLGNLKKIININLSQNQLSGGIPASLGGLPKITVLDLSSNQLTGAIPAELGSFLKITDLLLSNNQLSGNIPVELGKLRLLIRLNLANNQLSGSIPAELGSLTFKTSDAGLYLNNNNLTGSIPAELNNIAGVRYLHLEYNNLSGTVPAFLSTSGKYTQLGLQYNHFTFDGMEALAQHSFAGLVYWEQKNIALHQTTSTLSVYAGGTLSNNTYKWYKNGVLIATKKGDSTFKPTETGQYYVSVTNTLATKLTLLSDADTFAVVLPVELVYFDAIASDGKVQLKWQTASETNNAYFTIQRSAGATKWENIQTIKGKGTTALTSNYESLDNNPMQGTSYYRLQQVDADGKSSYSGNKKVTFSNLQVKYTVYPNPIGDHIVVQWKNGNAPTAISLYSSGGQLIPVNYTKENNEITIPAVQLAKGIYILWLQNSNGQTTYKKLFKK